MYFYKADLLRCGGNRSVLQGPVASEVLVEQAHLFWTGDNGFLPKCI